MSRNPVERCDHELVTSEYLERADGQHEVTICENCTLILADHGHPQPSNVSEGGA